MDFKLPFADIVVIIGYFVIMIAIGLYFMNRMGDIHEFFGGKGQVPWWLSGMSFYMSAFSAFSFVTYSAMAYTYGFVAVTCCWLAAPAVLIAAECFAVRWRRAAKTSALEYIETRYDNKVRQWLVWLTIPLRTIDDGFKLFAIGTLVSAGLGFPLKSAIIFSGIITLAYTFLGGLWAVVVTDFVQAIIMLVAIVILVPLALARVGGFESLVNQLPPEAFHLTSEKVGWTFIFSFLIILVLNYSSSWALVQRFYSVATDRDARKVGWMVAVLNFVVPPFMFLPALCARLFLPDVANPNDIYALLCQQILPIGMMGLVIAAMFAATMSMLSGDYNSMAGVLTNDVYRAHIRPDASPEHLMKVARISTLLLGIVALGVSFLVMNSPGSKNLFEMMVQLFSVFIAPIALPMIAGLVSRRVTATGALAGLITGIVAGAAIFLFYKESPDAAGAEFATQINTLGSAIATLAGIIAGSRADARERARIDEFFARLHGDDDALAHREESRALNAILPVIGYSIMAQGALMIGAILFASRDPGSTFSLCVGAVITAIGACFVALGSLRRRRIQLALRGQLE